MSKIRTTDINTSGATTGQTIIFDGTIFTIDDIPTPTVDYADLTGKPTFALVATSGDYDDLSNKPTLFDGAFSSLSGKPTTLSGYGITDAISSSLLGANSGVATLDSGGKVPSGQLPSYVDDVLEYADYASLPGTGETGKIYLTIDGTVIICQLNILFLLALTVQVENIWFLLQCLLRMESNIFFHLQVI